MTSLLPGQQSWQESSRAALVASPPAVITVAGVVVIMADTGGSDRKIRFLHQNGHKLPLFHRQGNIVPRPHGLVLLSLVFVVVYLVEVAIRYNG